MRRDRQIVTVQVTLIGVQDISVAAHRPETDGATVGMRIGPVGSRQPVASEPRVEVWASLA